MSQAVVSSVSRLSTISETDSDLEPGSPVSVGGGQWAGSRTLLCSNQKPSLDSSTFTSLNSLLPDAGEDCASILLACLHCRFSKALAMLPGAGERALARCCPAYIHYRAAGEQNPATDTGNRKLELDCGLLNCCQETSDLLELAMEISEVCYR
ncbi:myoD family inhibitor domain-containing protein 2-like [Astyanax mexicanus]|uniref:myoD family inhibitor domain-containing protein 2-like n=1 Tax=Astyanax mexicanus TaxID=7994 RepID=UPI0020CB237C|nr:myoD family inhibitor domain-containing protein 2-like [Astyanax mexicanus]